jgi:toxin-antitoxin system PIN domain toxin
MIVPDVNLLIYAHNADAPRHEETRVWLQDILNGSEAVGLPWAVICGFIRIATHPRVFLEPMRSEQALSHTRAWLSGPSVTVLDPGPRHLEIMARLLTEAGTAGTLTTDAHLAAIAIEHNCTLASNDSDFGRFSGLRWVNPLG